MSEWSGWLYRSDDGREVRAVAPRGLILPPTFEAHVPLVGAVVFHYVGSFEAQGAVSGTPEEPKR